MKSRVTPSTAHIWGVRNGCTGYAVMSARYEVRKTDASTQGILGHKLLEGGNAENVDQEIIDAVDSIKQFMTRFPLDGHSEFSVTSNAIHAENKGKIDYVRYDAEEHTLTIIDYKLGRTPVEVYENPQLMNYAALAICELGLGPDVTVDFWILQPRGFHRDGPFRQWTVRASDLEKHWAIMLANAEEAYANPQVRSGSYCVHCPARFNCPSAVKSALSLYEATHAAIPSELDTQQQANYLKLLREAKKRIEKIETGLSEELEHKARSGVPIPGWGLETTSSRRKWDLDHSQIAILGTVFGKTLLKREPITPTQAIASGIDEDVIKRYSSRSKGSKLTPTSKHAIIKKFGDENQ